VLAGQGIEEIALIYGVEVDVQKVSAVISSILQRNLNGIENLSQSERSIVLQYANLYQSFTNGNASEQGQQMLQNILMTSIGSSSQVMAFELI
jgi:hypothetical protein